MKNVSVLIMILMFISGCSAEAPKAEKEQAMPKTTEKAVFAGGCFWCVESAFSHMQGVIKAVSGYTGGAKANPTYEEVCTGATGHYEAVEVTFDPSKVSYLEVLNKFWQQIDPTDAGGQFADRGSQYHAAVLYTSEEQKRIAEASKKAIDASRMFDKPVVTQILKAKEFYPAEEYHQDYADKNPVHYKMYKAGSGRSKYLEDKWAHRTCPLPNKIDIKGLQRY